MCGMHGRAGVKALVAQVHIKCLYLRQFFCHLLRGEACSFRNNLKIVIPCYMHFRVKAIPSLWEYLSYDLRWRHVRKENGYVHQA